MYHTKHCLARSGSIHQATHPVKAQRTYAKIMVPKCATCINRSRVIHRYSSASRSLHRPSAKKTGTYVTHSLACCVSTVNFSLSRDLLQDVLWLGESCTFFRVSALDPHAPDASMLRHWSVSSTSPPSSSSSSFLADPWHIDLARLWYATDYRAPRVSHGLAPCLESSAQTSSAVVNQ